MLIDALEWAGSILGLAGAFLLATHTRLSRYGWLAFLAANLAMIGFAVGIERYGLLVQQIGFLGTSLLGLYRAGMLNAILRRRASSSAGVVLRSGRTSAVRDGR